MPFDSGLLLGFFLGCFAHSLLLRIFAPRLISQIAAGALQRAALGWGKGSLVVLMLVNMLVCGWLHEGYPGLDAASRLQENILANFWRPCLRGFCFPQRLFPTHDFVPILQTAQLLLPGRRHVTVPAHKCLPNPRVLSLALLQLWTCLGCGFVTLSKACPTSPTPVLGSGPGQPNTISAGLLGSKVKRYFKALLSSLWFFRGYSTCSMLLYVHHNFSPCFCCSEGLNLYQICLQQPIPVILLCTVHMLNGLRGLSLYLIFISSIY